MSLDRHDVRFKVTDDERLALREVAEIEGLDIAEYCRAVVVRDAHRKISLAMRLADRLRSLKKWAGEFQGISGNSGE